MQEYVQSLNRSMFMCICQIFFKFVCNTEHLSSISEQKIYPFTLNFKLKLLAINSNEQISFNKMKLVDIFKKYNHEIRIAGGAVRDLLSGEKIPDDVSVLLSEEAVLTNEKRRYIT